MQTSSDIIALPGFELDLAQMLLRDAVGSEVRLRPQAFAVLQLLARHAGRVVTKDELMQAVWAGTVVTDDSLVQCVKEIRLALRDHDHHNIIRTAPKRGYWMVLPGTNGVGINGAGVDGAAAEQTMAMTPAGSRRRFGLGGAVALAVGGAGGVAGLSWWLLGGAGARIQPRAEQPSIVVLPIRNISGGERWDRLARGLTEDITTDLARNHWLLIIASSAAFQRAAGSKDALAIARELGVRFALEGSLQTGSAGTNRPGSCSTSRIRSSGRSTIRWGVRGRVRLRRPIAPMQGGGRRAIWRRMSCSCSGSNTSIGSLRTTWRRHVTTCCVPCNSTPGLQRPGRLCPSCTST